MEPFISRLPSILPAYDTETGGITFFDENSIGDRRGKNPSNWGMIPINIVLNKKPSPSSSEYIIKPGCHCYGNFEVGEDNKGFDDLENCDEAKFIMSFRTLSDWYYFFKEYYNLLKGYGHCSRVYTSAEDYYNNESINGYADQMIYGIDKDTYLELDKTFKERGGKVMARILNKDTGEISLVEPDDAHDEYDGDKTTIIDVIDNAFYKWICENVVPSFHIPMIYKDAWKRDTLFYPDVNKWIPWFQNRLEYEDVYNETDDTWECKKTDDCCDCEEYFSRGGKRILDLMVEWYERVNENIRNINSIVFNADDDMPLACYIPTMILPTSIRNGSENLGLESIFAPEYQAGIDYRVASGYGATENTEPGTVVTYNGEGQILIPSLIERKDGEEIIKEQSPGFLYQECMMESYRHEEAFEPFLKEGENGKYLKELALASTTRYYTYDENNQYVWSSASTEADAIEELTEKLGKRYDLTNREKGWLFKDGKLLEIMESEYGIYDERNKYIGGQKFFVDREEGTNTPYTIIHGKKIYADFDVSTSTFYFPFFFAESASDNKTNSSIPNCDKDFDITKYKQFKRMENEGGLLYVMFDGLYYPIEKNQTSINDVIYDNIIYYNASTDDKTYYIKDKELKNNSKIYLNLDGSLEEEADEIELRKDGNTWYLFKKYTGVVVPTDASHIKGVTRSKLLPLRLSNNLVDDVGNDIDGIFNPQSISGYTYSQPPQMSVLEPLYQVGNTANIQRYSNTIEDIEDLDEEKPINYFVGDIITKMHFFCLDGNGNIVENENDKVIVEISNIEEKKYYTKESIEKVNAYREELLKKNDEEQIDKLYSLQDGVFCDVTYYIGATLQRKEIPKDPQKPEGEKKNDIFRLAEDIDVNNEKFKFHKGVEYTERVCFLKEAREYYTRKPDVTSSTLPKFLSKIINHSASYPIFVYTMHQVGDVYDMPGENDEIEEVHLANFKVQIGIFYPDHSHSLDNTDIEKYNGLQASPTYREEYRLGQSMIEKVDTDIFIERGLSAAFEKHLKLGEVTSLEALEQMGNGYFKFKED